MAQKGTIYLGYIWKKILLPTPFKNSPYLLWRFGLFWKTFLFLLKLRGYFLGNFRENWQFSIPPSGHTGLFVFKEASLWFFTPVNVINIFYLGDNLDTSRR